jgi:hypothetical protein
MHRGYTCLWRKIWSNSVLSEPGKRFSRFEAWIYITNVLAAGVDDPAAGLKRGEFVASVRRCAEHFNWSRGAVLRFIELLVENAMIMRVGHQAGQEAGHFSVCNYGTYNAPRDAGRDTERNTFKEVLKERKKIQDTCVSSKILFELYQQHNRALPEVKALTVERLGKCRSRINQAVRDGCLEQYLADFSAAVQKAQSTPFLRGEGARGWRASFDWFVANHRNVYAVLEGKYDSGGSDHASCVGLVRRRCSEGGRTSRGDPVYIPRQ